jgi:alpha-tubulin suppressor-like RCC1 family protein
MLNRRLSLVAMMAVVGLVSALTTFVDATAARASGGSFVVSAAFAPPSAPSGATATAGPGQATVSWIAPIDDGGSPIVGYVVFAYVGYAPAVEHWIFNSTATTQTVTGLTNGTQYRFRVLAYNAVGPSGFSKVTVPVTTPSVPGQSIIGAVVPGDGTLTVSWTAPIDDGGWPITGYVVTPYYGYFPLPSTTFSSTATTQVMTGLRNGVMLRFKVAAINAVGVGKPSSVSVAMTPESTTGAFSVAVGRNWACALEKGGAVECWGDNSSGQLGDGQLADGTTVSSLTPVEVPGVIGATQIAVGYDHTCALLTGGVVDCWGGNTFGQLGDGTTSNSSVPLRVRGIQGATSLATGSGYTCVVVAGGAIDCWGGNYKFALGYPTEGVIPTPVPSSITAGATQVVAGVRNTCALVGGQVQCWGDNFNDALGVDYATLHVAQYPIVVPGITAATSLSSTGNSVCALLSDGTVTCWGATPAGIQLPTVVLGINTATQISTSGTDTCAVLVQVTVECWGDNSLGQLGNGTTIDSSTPQSPLLSGTVTNVSAGGRSTCAIVDTFVECWGDNSSGQLGTGTTVESTTPEQVLALAAT